MVESVWRVVDLTYPFVYGLDFEAVCRCAVDRSQGQLTNLSITQFGDDELLSYVAHRSSRLRRLKFDNPFNNISAFALMEAVKKLPLLEEMHLIKISPLYAECVEAIGISCPLLKSFTYEQKWGLRLDSNFEDEFNGVALAIAKTMPNLHYLRLVENRTKQEGLEAILDGCPDLESPDLSDCYGLHLISGALRERCFNQIKFLRLPIEPSYDDFETSANRFDALKFGDFYDKYSHDLYHDYCS